jgi:hypothetical protein
MWRFSPLRWSVAKRYAKAKVKRKKAKVKAKEQEWENGGMGEWGNGQQGRRSLLAGLGRQ